MSTQSIITPETLKTEAALDSLLKSMTLDFLKFVRFNVGCVNHETMRDVLRLVKLQKQTSCLDDKQIKKLREDIIRKSILRIDGL